MRKKELGGGEDSKYCMCSTVGVTSRNGCPLDSLSAANV